MRSFPYDSTDCRGVLFLSPENENARFYAVTAGAPVEIPRGAQEIRIRGLADSKAIGFGDTSSLLNIRTTGIGAGAPVTLQQAGQVTYITGGSPQTDSVQGEAYERIRDAFIGSFRFTVENNYDFDGTAGDAYKVVFEAPNGIAGDEEGYVNLDSPYANDGDNADLAFAKRLGEHFSYVHPNLRHLSLTKDFFKLCAAPISGDGERIELPLKLESFATDDGISVRAKVIYENVGGEMKGVIYLNKADVDARLGADFEDARLYASYDSCVFQLIERSNATSLDPNSSALEYFVAGDKITFNRELENAVVVRPLSARFYRIGKDLTITRTAEGGNRLTFLGEGNQPGEAGGPIGHMQVVFGADYEAEPEWPEIASTAAGAAFDGGSSGANDDPAELVAAYEQSLLEFKDQSFRVLVASGLHIDDATTSYDPTTGLASERPAGLVEAVQRFFRAVGEDGASGIAYLSVKPMKPSTAHGRFTDDQIRRRFKELVERDATEPLRPANVIGRDSAPEFFYFDAPMEVISGSRIFTSNGTAFFAGVRSALTNATALYQIQMPAFVRPLYRYNVPITGGRMTEVLAELARVNSWSARRGEARLADERTGAGLVPGPTGELVRSNFTYGSALLAANDFKRASEQALSNLIGPLQGGLDGLRANIETQLRNTAERVVGVEDILFNRERDIDIFSKTGNAIGIRIRVTLIVQSEVREITLSVGSIGQARLELQDEDAIPSA